MLASCEEPFRAVRVAPLDRFGIVRGDFGLSNELVPPLGTDRAALRQR